MKLVNAVHGLEIDFKEGTPEVLILENEISFRNIAGEIWKQCNGEDGDFVLSNGKILKLDKHMVVISNPFDLDFQNRKVTSALYAKMSQIGSEKVAEKSLLNTQMINLIENITDSINYTGITFQLDFDWNDLFKMYSVKIEAPDNFLIRMIEFIKVMTCLCGISLFCFYNLKSYLSEDELLLFYKEADYNKVSLLLIESFESKQMDGEHITIIDKDLCVIKKI